MDLIGSLFGEGNLIAVILAYFVTLLVIIIYTMLLIHYKANTSIWGNNNAEGTDVTVCL